MSAPRYRPDYYFRNSFQAIQHNARTSVARLVVTVSIATLLLVALALTSACRSDGEVQRVRPRQLRDVPAQKLAFALAADVDAPPNANAEESKTIQAIQQDFDERRKDEGLVLLRTVASPDGQRAVA